MSGIEITIDARFGNVQKAMQLHAKQFDSKVQELMNNLQDVAERWIRIETPRKTGRLMSATRHEGTGDFRNIYVSKSIAPYFDCVVEGTRPHDIYPKNGQALYWPGAPYPVKVVHHRGSKANDYIEKAFYRMLPDVDKQINKFHEWLVTV